MQDGILVLLIIVIWLLNKPDDILCPGIKLKDNEPAANRNYKPSAPDDGRIELNGEIFKDKILICSLCSEEFVFTAAAQEYFFEKGITELPRLCKSCYMKRKRDGGRGNRPGH
jgi:hypothetical protein